MSSAVPSATLATVSAPGATDAPAVAQLSTKDSTQDGAGVEKGGNGPVKPSDTDASISPSVTDSSATTTPTSPAPNAAPDGDAGAKSSVPPSASQKDGKASGNAKTGGAANGPAQSTQDSATPSNTPNSNSDSNSNTAATPTSGGSSSDSSAGPGTTQSSVTTPSNTIPGPSDSSPTAPPTNPTSNGPSISGADTQSQTNVQLSSPSSISSSSNSGNSFLQNKGLVIGLAVAGGVVIALFLIYAIVRCMRSRRRRQLDREMDASFEETVNRWRPPPTVPDQDQGADLRRAPSAMSTASASYAAYAEPPMAVAPQQPNYGFGYAPPQQEYWTAAAAPPQMGMAMGAPAMAMGMGMGAAPGMMQQPRGEAYATQTHAQWDSGLVHRPSQRAPQPQVQARNDYLSNYVSPAPEAESPVSPTPMPNPFDSKDERVLKVANE